MKIAIDRGPLDNLNATRGVGAYTKNLLHALQLLSKSEKFTVEAIDARSTDLSPYDIVHYPYFDFFRNTLKPSPFVKTVVTIHDTIPLLYPKQYPPGIRGRINFNLQKRALRKVSHVVTVSETSKKDIVRLLPVTPNKVTAIYEGPTVSNRKVSAQEMKEIRKKYDLPNTYILYVGDVNWNKNLLTLCLAATKTKTHLVIIGKAAVNTEFDKTHIENQPLVSLVEKYGSSPYIHRLGFVEEDLDVFFKGALCYCQPSFYEGFGLPVLDALLLKTPVICAKTQALVELYEGCALFFEPNDPATLVNSIKLLLHDPKQKIATTMGEERATYFSWEKTAQKTYEVYKKLLNN
jgi:glycosyltransferase involved in cell wall biosynthesis